LNYCKKGTNNCGICLGREFIPRREITFTNAGRKLAV
jgi:hypothetical protein